MAATLSASPCGGFEPRGTDGAADRTASKEVRLEASSIELRVGETHVVTLGGLASAGYAWSATVEGPQGIVSVAQDSVEGPAPAAPGGGPSPGSFSRDYAYRIAALKAGATRVRFALRRPFEQGKAPLREVVVDVHVR